MNQSLTAAFIVQTNQPSRNKKIFLLAGLYHLWQDTSQQFFCDSQMSLESLYELLSGNKAVILIPKQPITNYWNSFYQISP
jgi:hypothetical protein